ncbi:MAG: acetylglutamate kinase [Flavobacteriaceae bacterium]|nr:acetylglutamate kinase [Bacteroidia bacterium]NNF76175.1 acetylglutamate kinase [Flavobacteriaceae bacterium]NNK72142.1 acetylglutamate kinase [Flavobacteriaceae bacterium]
MKKESIHIVKIGSAIVDENDVLEEFLSDFTALESPKILIHGGGKSASKLAKELNIPVKMHKGRRITCNKTLDVITMTYAGKINKNLVAKLQLFGCNALGLSGADGDVIRAKKRSPNPIDFGHVGDVTSVNANLIATLLNAGIIPVFCAMTHDMNGNLLNTNADTIASEIAIALSSDFETKLYYAFDQPGVMRDLNDKTSLINEITSDSYEELKNKRVISDGMIPKLDNCMHALDHGVEKIYIGDQKLLKPNSKSFTLIH